MVDKWHAPATDGLGPDPDEHDFDRAVVHDRHHLEWNRQMFRIRKQTTAIAVAVAYSRSLSPIFDE
eukprot:SAG22_NODE_2878_length_2132_cov_0.997049_1_plen_66_part_00